MPNKNCLPCVVVLVCLLEGQLRAMKMSILTVELCYGCDAFLSACRALPFPVQLESVVPYWEKWLLWRIMRIPINQGLGYRCAFQISELSISVWILARWLTQMLWPCVWCTTNVQVVKLLYWGKSIFSAFFFFFFLFKMLVPLINLPPLAVSKYLVHS